MFAKSTNFCKQMVNKIYIIFFMLANQRWHMARMEAVLKMLMDEQDGVSN